MDSVGAHQPKKRRLPPWMMGAATSNQVREENKDDRVGSINHAALDSEITLPEVQKRSQKIVKKCFDEDKEMRVSEEVCAPKLKTRSRKVVNKNLDEDEDAHGSEEVCSPKLKRRSKRIQKGPLHEDEEANADDSCILVKCDSIKRKRKNSSANASDVHSIGNEKFIQISAPQKKKKGNVNKLTPNEAASSCTDSGRELLMEDLIGIAQEYVNALIAIQINNSNQLENLGQKRNVQLQILLLMSLHLQFQQFLRLNALQLLLMRNRFHQLQVSQWKIIIFSATSAEQGILLKTC